MTWFNKCLHRKQNGFTLVELLVALVITALIASGAGVATIQTLKTSNAVNASNQYVYDVRATVTNDINRKPTEEWGYNGQGNNGDGLSPYPVVNVVIGTVTSSSATLNGELVSLGAYNSVQCSFAWGTTTGYGNTTSTQVLNAPGTFTAVLSGLESGATYYVRAIARHGNIVAYSGVVSFSTPSDAPPSVASSASVSGETSTTATFNGELTGLGSAASVQVSFEYGLSSLTLTSATPAQTISATGPFTASVTGLTAGTNYFMRAKAQSSGGTAYSNVVSFNTLPQTYSVYDYGIIALNGNLGITNNAQVVSDPASPANGNIYAKGNISLENNVNVSGNARATGTITLGSNAHAGSQNPGSASLTFNNLPETTSLRSTAQSGGELPGLTLANGQSMTLDNKLITGNLVLNNNCKLKITGVVYVEGSVTFKNNAYIEGPGTLVSTQSIEVKNNVTRLASDAIPLIISIGGNIEFKNNGEVTAILYAKNGTVEIKNNARVYGSIIGYSGVTIGNNCVVTYPASLE